MVDVLIQRTSWSHSAGGAFQHGLSMASDPAWQGSYDPKAFDLDFQVER
jgi:hypothetical protein